MFIWMDTVWPSPHWANASSAREEGKCNYRLSDTHCAAECEVLRSFTWPSQQPRAVGVMIPVLQMMKARLREPVWDLPAAAAAGQKCTPRSVWSQKPRVCLHASVSQQIQHHLNWYFLCVLVGFTFLDSFIKNRTVSKKIYLYLLFFVVVFFFKVGFTTSMEPV